MPDTEPDKHSRQRSDRTDQELVHRRLRWGIYSATGAAAFFLVGFVATWQVALSSVVNAESDLRIVMILMYGVAAIFVALTVASFLSARTLVR